MQGGLLCNNSIKSPRHDWNENGGFWTRANCTPTALRRIDLQSIGDPRYPGAEENHWGSRCKSKQRVLHYNVVTSLNERFKWETMIWLIINKPENKFYTWKLRSAVIIGVIISKPCKLCFITQRMYYIRRCKFVLYEPERRCKFCDLIFSCPYGSDISICNLQLSLCDTVKLH